MRKILHFYFVIFFCIQFFTTLTAQEYTDWKYTHPTPHANTLRAIQMIDASTWVAAGANGCFMKTTNAGANWYFHFEAGKYADAAQTINQNYAVWFFDGNTGIVGGDRGYLGRTTNGGITFDSSDAGVIPVAQRVQGIWFADNNTGYAAAGTAAGSNGTIVKTTNGGQSWTLVHTAASSIYAIAGTSANTVYAFYVNGIVIKSTDGGTTWVPSGSPVVSQFMYAAAFVDDNTGFTTGGEGYISRTTNAGLTWEAITRPQTNNWAFFDIEIVSANEIYFVGDPSFLYKTTDLGATFTAIPLIVSGTNTFIWYSVEKTGNTLTVSGDYGVVIKSDDGGNTWSTNSVVLNTGIIFDVEYLPGTNRVWAAGRQVSTSGTKQIYVSTNYGSSWTTQDLNENTNADQVSMFSNGVGYISGTNSKMFKTTNMGETWFPITSPGSITTMDLYTMDFITPEIGWVFVNFSTVSGGNIFKTTDGGQTWTQQTNGLSNSIYNADMVDQNVGYHTINSTSRPIYKTTDGGASWTAVTIPFTGMVKAIRALDADNVYIGASSGTTRVAKTTNGGTTWTNISLPIAVDITSMDFIDVNTGYIIGNSSQRVVCRTTDGGLTWTFRNLRLPTLLKVKATAGDTVFITGTYGTIFRNTAYGVIPVELTSFTANVSGEKVKLAWTTATETNNSGFEIQRAAASVLQESEKNWEVAGFVNGRGTTTQPGEYEFIDNPAAGSYVYRLRQIDFDGTYSFSATVNADLSQVPSEFSLDQNYPNPFNPSTKIAFSLSEMSDVRLTVFNSLGEEVASVFEGILQAGRYEYNFDAKNLPSSMYIYKLSAGNKVLQKSMMLVK